MAEDEIWGRDGRGVNREFRSALEERRITTDLIEQDLLKEEVVYWSGRPQWRPWVYREDLGSLGFGLFVFGFAIVWTALAIWAAISGGRFEGIFFPLFGLPFVAIGWHVVSKPFFQARSKSSELYAITDRRIFVVTQFPNRELKAFYVNNAEALSSKPVKGRYTGLKIKKNYSVIVTFRALSDSEGAIAALEKLDI